MYSIYIQCIYIQCIYINVFNVYIHIYMSFVQGLTTLTSYSVSFSVRPGQASLDRSILLLFLFLLLLMVVIITINYIKIFIIINVSILNKIKLNVNITYKKFILMYYECLFKYFILLYNSKKCIKNCWNLMVWRLISAPVKYEDLQHMYYLDCIIKETLRLFPTIPLIGRQLTEDLKIGVFIFFKPASITNFLEVFNRNKD